MNKFSQRLKELRIENGLSQEKLSKQIGFNQPAIARWEDNQHIPSIEVLIKFAQFFNVTTDYLVGLQEFR